MIDSWANAPNGSIRSYGEITLSISGDKPEALACAYRIRKISGGENFGGSAWSR